MALQLVTPSLKYEKEILAYKKEMLATGDPHLHGCSSLENYATLKEWFIHLESYRDKNTLDPKLGLVEGSQWLLIDDSKKRILGMVNIRHDLNDYLLKYGGHIGYSIRPSERQKGYGHLQLKLALGVLKAKGLSRALVTCDDDNVASAKTIESCGGILENTVISSDQQKWVRRYWITL